MLCFLSPHVIDTLQLVDSTLSALIEQHRRARLPRHELDIIIRTAFNGCPLYIETNCIRNNRPTVSQEVAPLSNFESLARRLEGSRVGRVQRLTIRKEAIGSAEVGEGMQWLSTRLLTERIPVESLVAGDRRRE